MGDFNAAVRLYDVALRSVGAKIVLPPDRFQRTSDPTMYKTPERWKAETHTFPTHIADFQSIIR